MSRRRISTIIVVLLVAGGAFWLATRPGDSPRVSAVAPASGRVVLPGKPGESARVADAGDVAAPPGPTFNALDSTFVQMMIEHHNQAIEMAALAPTRAGDPSLRALAARIGAAQAPEVEWLKAWLRDRRLPSSSPSHDHGSMPGMQSPAEMAELAELRGTAFDHKFVTMMTAHHRGAMQMAGDVVRGGADERLREVAGEMSVEQGSEIRRLADL